MCSVQSLVDAPGRRRSPATASVHPRRPRVRSKAAQRGEERVSNRGTCPPSAITSVALQ